ncbi:MAG: thioredoxin domain-containing protein [Deltaproteobacteria bacterium]|nr:thioredoxin domain-containing protein [Deltaproteobacteria bacterium]
MTKLVLLALALAACQPDTKNIERKIDALTQEVRALRAGGVGGAAGGAAPAARPQRVEPNPAKTYAVNIEGDPFDGPADAKITIVKAYDYACPFCERARGTMDQIHEKYGNDVRVVYKQLVVHPQNAMAGALAFCAAGKQGKHKEMDAAIWDKGFKRNRDLDMSEVKDGDKTAMCWDTDKGCEKVVTYASELGLNVDQFKADMKGACQEQIKKDGAVMRQLSVAATPAFFVNGRFIPGGAVPMANFVPVIDEELAKANEAVQKGVSQAEYYEKVVVGQGLKSVQGG